MRPLLKSVADNRNVTALVDVYVDVYRADAVVRPCNWRFTTYTCSFGLAMSDFIAKVGYLRQIWHALSCASYAKSLFIESLCVMLNR